MPYTVSVDELTDLVTRAFTRHGVSAENAGPVAETVVAAERDGAASHGLLRLPGYVSTQKSGWVDGRAVPVVADAAPGLVDRGGERLRTAGLAGKRAAAAGEGTAAGYCRSVDPQLAPLRRRLA